MYKIYINTTTRYKKEVTLLKNETKIDSINGDIDIVTSIQGILKQNGLSLKDIQEVVPNPGPGSFTGIKIGIVIANVLNWVTEKKPIENLARPKYGKPPNIQS